MGKLKLKSKHRLLCGDSTSEDDVARLLDGEKADMCFTDPPYGQGFAIVGDTKHEYKNIFSLAFANLCNSCEDDIYICCNFACIGHFCQAIESHGLMLYEKIAWVKNLFGQGRLYHRQHEDILFCGWGNYRKENRNNDTDVWNENGMRNFAGNETAKEDVGHPTQKPIAIPTRAIKNSSKRGATVLDLFLGSGSTLIACEQLNRKCYGMEIDPLYCDVVVKRWENLTGERAVLNA